MRAYSTSTTGNIVILGAGLAGLAAAWRLSASFGNRVILLEKQPNVGGLAATINIGEDLRFDLGSHRLHKSCDPEVLELVRWLCDNELLEHKRRGLVLLEGKFVDYPPTVLGLLKAFGPVRCFLLAAGLAKSQIAGVCSRTPSESFDAYAISRLGKPLYNLFYKPYAEKLWGKLPEEMSKEAAIRRMRSLSLLRFSHRGEKADSSTYLYPRQGIGQIAESLKSKILANGAQIEFGALPEQVSLSEDRSITGLSYLSQNGEKKTIEVERLISTISPRDLCSLLETEATRPPPCELVWRSLLLVFFRTKDWIEQPNETYYIPSPRYLLGRISDIRKYSPNVGEEGDYKTLTLEIPCTKGDHTWNLENKELLAICQKELAQFGIVKQQTSETPTITTLKLENVYPVYSNGWQKAYTPLASFFDSFPNLYRIGRSALFLHCNLDHSMQMGFKVANFLMSSDKSKAKWKETEKSFSNYYVRE